MKHGETPKGKLETKGMVDTFWIGEYIPGEQGLDFPGGMVTRRGKARWIGLSFFLQEKP